MRIGEQARKTGETDIFVSIQLDGEGNADVHSGIGFFDHMLSAVAKHGLFDLTVRVKGDLEVDGHHTVEDTGIVLGAAIAQALGDKKGIRRVGSCFMPMDEKPLLLCAGHQRPSLSRIRGRAARADVRRLCQRTM